MTGKCIVLGVGGGIAAYKIADLASQLTQAGHDVHVVLTEAATRFVTPLTFQALTHNPALSSLWVPPGDQTAGMAAGMPHIDLADKADLIVVAPATADLLARLAAGMADDLLTTLVLASRAPLWVAPAMNPTMLAHPATQANIKTLVQRGVRVLDPETGRTACEHVGAGRLPATPVLLEEITRYFGRSQSWQHKKVLVTAGPTREALDPVRYLSNRSSGKMGYAIAAAAAARGAQVVLVSGPTHLGVPPGVTRVDVTTALEMQAATDRAFGAVDVLIAAAAPADFRVQAPAEAKIKRAGVSHLQLELVANPDILAGCASRRRPGQLLVGFAAETGDPVAEARRKLVDKGLDAVVANDVTAPGAGFDVDTNEVVFVTAQAAERWPLQSKNQVAAQLLDALEQLQNTNKEAMS